MLAEMRPPENFDNTGIRRGEFGSVAMAGGVSSFGGKRRQLAETNPRPLTFSQAQGYEPIPGPLALEEISEEARNKLWSLLYTHVADGTDGLNRVSFRSWMDILLYVHINFLGHPSDEFNFRLDLFIRQYKGRLLTTEPFQQDFRHPGNDYAAPRMPALLHQRGSRNL